MRLTIAAAAAAVILGTASVAAAQCGTNNQCPVVDAVSLSVTPPPAGQTVFLTCQAHDNDGVIKRLAFSASHGTFSNGTKATEVATQQGASATATVAWTAPNTVGTRITLGCIAWDNGDAGGTPTPSPPRLLIVNPSDSSQVPLISAATASPNPVLPQKVAEVTITATDPQGGALTYSWIANGGTISGDKDADPHRVSWTAPSTPGTYTVLVSVRDDGNNTTSAVISVDVSAAIVATSMSIPGLLPANVAADAAGNLYVTDGRAGRVVVFNPLGRVLRTIEMLNTPTAIAVSPSGALVYVGDLQQRRVDAYNRAGKIVGSLGIGANEFTLPSALDIDTATGLVYVADSQAGRVKVYKADGTFASTFKLNGLAGGLAFASSKVYVGNVTAGYVEVFSPTGNKIGTIGSFGAGSGSLTRVSGLDLAANGTLLAVDAFQSRVVAFSSSGSFLYNVGVWGSKAGQLRTPGDVVVDPFGRIVITNINNQRLEVFHTAQTNVTNMCAVGDTDCDGIPDAWETANGLDPNDPTDAYADPDKDGLVNIDEYKKGTDPRDPDTDKDGVKDGDEVNAGTNPLNASDNRPVADPGADFDTPPTKVVLEGKGTDPNKDPFKTITWSQLSGPEMVALKPTSKAGQVWWVAKKAGEYTFTLTVNDGKVDSQAKQLKVKVLQVAPDANAGPDVGSRRGDEVTLDGRFSRDANGDTLTYAWKQTAGPTASLSDADKATARFTPSKSGVYRFELTVDDGKAKGTDSVTVIVGADGDHVPVASVGSARLSVAANSKVTLDGSSSVDSDGDKLTYKWAQTGGPNVTLSSGTEARPSFTPTARGVYRFTLTVNDGTHDSDPAEVIVVVRDTADGSPPAANAGYDQRVKAFEAVSLPCAASYDADGDEISCSWSQVEGVKVPLEGPAKPTSKSAPASFVPIVSGTYAFELTVSDAKGEGTRDRVYIVVDDPGKNSVPVTAARASGNTANPKAPVTLDARESHDAQSGDTLGYHWTQTAGARVVLSAVSGSKGEQVTFQPSVGGRYTFELRVDDGKDIGPPVVVEYTVSGANAPPVADAGKDVLVVAGQEVRLDGRASKDPDGDTLSYRWQQVGGPQTELGAAASDAQPTVKPALGGFTLRYQLVVNDGQVDSKPAFVNVNVVDVPLALRPVEPAKGGKVVVSGTASPFEGASVDVPAGAIAGGAVVSVALGEVKRDWYAEHGRKAVGTALFFGPIGALRLDKAVTLELPLPSGVDSADLALVRFDHQAAQWKPADGLSVAGERVKIETRKSGVYLLTVPADDDDGGCGCRAGGSGGAGAATPLLLLLLLLGIGHARRRRAEHATNASRAARATSRGPVVVGLLVAAPLALLPSAVSAKDPPHDDATFDCFACHTPHTINGPALTNATVNADLCMSCHNSSGGATAPGKPFASADQAVPGTSGTSHNWTSNATNATYGATGPTNSELRLSGGTNLMCSTCHNQHKQTYSPFDPTAPSTPGSAGRHFQRIDNDTNQMCNDCHAPRADTSVRTWDSGNELSHPVNVALPSSNARFNNPPKEIQTGTASGGTTTTVTDSGMGWGTDELVGEHISFITGANAGLGRKITANTSGSITFIPALPSAVLSGVKYEITRDPAFNDGNDTNNLLLTNLTNNVVCMSCHAVHYSDSDSSTVDGPPGTGLSGDGKLLRRTNSDALCQSCHNVTVHRSAEFATPQHNMGHGDNCMTCHTTHGGTNIMLIRSSIQTPNSGVKSVDFRTRTGQDDANPNGFVSPAATPGLGICEVCHTQTKYYNQAGNAKEGSQGHYTGGCNGCHDHSKGFEPQDPESKGNRDCGPCHNYQMATSDPSRQQSYHHVMDIAVVLNPNTQYPTNATPVTGGTDKTCTQCHVDHNLFRDSVNASNAHGRGANLRTSIANAPGSPPAANSTTTELSPGYFTNRDAEPGFSAGGICMSCHLYAQTKDTTNQKNDGTTQTPAIVSAVADWNTSPHAYVVSGTIANGTSTFIVRCTKCHASDPNDMNQFGDGIGVNAPDAYQGAGTIPAINLTDSTLHFKPSGESTYPYENVEPMPNSHQTGDSFNGGTWTSRSMSPNAATAADDTFSVSWNQKNASGLKFRMVTLISPPVATATTVPAGNWDIKVYASANHSDVNAYVRYHIYVWRANDSLATPAIAGPATDGTRISIGAATRIDISASSGAVNLAVGDKIGVDLIFDLTSSARNNPYSGYFYLGSSSPGSLAMPGSVEFNMSPEQADTSPKYALHQGTNRRLLAPLGITSTNTDCTANGDADCSAGETCSNGACKKDPLGEAFCLRCHSLTSDSNPGGGPAKSVSGRDYYNAADMSTQSERINLLVNLTYKHPVGDGPKSHKPIEGTSAGWNPSGANRHVQCEDCHNAHAAGTVGNFEDKTYAISGYSSGTPDTLTISPDPGWTADQWRGYAVKILTDEGGQRGTTSAIYGNTSNQLKVKLPGAPGNAKFTIYNLGRPDFSLDGNHGGISNALRGATGVVPSSWPTPPAPSSWDDYNGQAGITVGQVADDETRFASIGSWTTSSTHAAICIKCHSDYTGTRPQTPSGHGTSSSSAWNNSPGTPYLQSDLSKQLNPKNLSHHAVFARGNNQPIRANFGQSGITSYYNTNGTQPWPHYTNGATVTITDGSGTVNNAWPITVLPGWYLYIGASAPSATSTGTGSTGYLEITSVTVGASSTTFKVRAEDGSGSYTTAINVSSGSWFISAGFGNTFVPPFGPWSLVKCGDCHQADGTNDPFGPHGSGTKWLLNSSKTQTFLWFDGTSVISVTNTPTDGTHVCLNCHRRDVYGDYNYVAMGNMAYLSRQPHPVDRGNGDGHKYRMAWGDVCSNCHGGTRGGAIHGSNLGVGTGAGSGTSYSGRRMLNGAVWVSVTRSSSSAAGACWTKGTTDAVSTCGQKHNGTTFGGPNSGKATYDYDSAVP